MRPGQEGESPRLFPGATGACLPGKIQGGAGPLSPRELGLNETWDGAGPRGFGPGRLAPGPFLQPRHGHVVTVTVTVNAS